MALFAYQQTTLRLLSDTRQDRFNIFDIRDWVNTARGQLAGDAECIRVYATLPIVAATQQYAFSSIVFPAGTTGVQSVLAVRTASYAVASGAKSLVPRPWPWFQRYFLNKPVPTKGPPTVYSQYGQGALGTLFVNLLDADYTLNLDCVCLPKALTNDSDPEAIPSLWSDAVPYFAAYMALLQTPGMDDRAAKMLGLYNIFVTRARHATTPSVLRHSYEQQADPTLSNKLGIQPTRSAAKDDVPARGP